MSKIWIRLVVYAVLVPVVLASIAVLGSKARLSAGTTAQSDLRAQGERAAATSRRAGIAITIEEVVASGFAAPVHVTHAGDGSGRLFVVEQGGRIQVVKAGSTSLFLDIADRVEFFRERGLLSVVFPPNYGAKGYFYVNYSRIEDGATVVARYRVTGDPDVADSDSEEIVLLIAQPYINHNGGQLAFGPDDGYLYIGMGDGGSSGDPENRAQDPQSLLGKMLRIDVETGNPLTYTVPASNPFTQDPGYRDEIWALGLRNPWRFSFDRATRDLYIGDVGQNAWEELDLEAAGSPGGVNYGWRCREGTHTYNTQPPCDDPSFLDTLTDPIIEYGREEGKAVTGGFVYRGSDYPSLVGRYFYADYVAGKIWSLDTEAGGPPELELDTSLNISSFGEDEEGELYVVDRSGGTIRRLAPRALDKPLYLPFIGR
jgi:glucose/arabinose dehydrogenase